METTKPYSGRKNTCFWNIGFMKNYFLSFCYTNTNLRSYWTRENTKKVFLWENLTSNIKHDTLCNYYKHGGLKNVFICNKIISLECLWIKRLYDDSFHEWKITPLHLISRTFSKSFIFYSNLSLKKKLIKAFPSFYKKILIKLKTFFSKTP